jgi:hypothetical protein
LESGGKSRQSCTLALLERPADAAIILRIEHISELALETMFSVSAETN